MLKVAVKSIIIQPSMGYNPMMYSSKLIGTFADAQLWFGYVNPAAPDLLEPLAKLKFYATLEDEYAVRHDDPQV